jgi:hypothetical protein
MKRIIVILTLVMGLLGFSDGNIKTFDNLNTAVSEYGKVMQEILNYASREDFNSTGDNLAGFLKSSGNTALEKKWEGIRNKLAEPYEIKAGSPKMQGSNKAVVNYDVYGYDEGKIAEMIDQSIQEFVQEDENGEITIDMEKYILSVEDFVNKSKKIKVAVTEIEFEKIAGKWMLKEKGAFEN